jgi:hypothetical protein
MTKQTTRQYQKKVSAPRDLEVPGTEFSDVYAFLENARNGLTTLINRLTPEERKRMLGAGVRRYGQIDKSMDYAVEFPQFVPPTFSLSALQTSKVNIEALRDMEVLVDEIKRLVGDGLLTEGNTAWGWTLMYYNSVREQARRNVSGAVELFNKLKLLFMRRRQPDSPETEPEVERDVRALLHGRKDGKIVIENEKPHLVGGKQVVVDETHKDKGTWKETEEG